MKIVMFTNTYLPHVGGVARSVSSFEEAFTQRGHEVRVVAPQFDGAADSSGRVLRTPAIQKFNGSDFSVRIPVPGLLSDFIDDFQPDILHSHHPFLLGDAALRLAWSRQLPLVFTHHTMYEQYTHYVPIDSAAIKRFAIQMATEYCNLCERVIAPSESVARLLAERGVTTPVKVIPTGIDVEAYARGQGERARQKHGIGRDEIVIGHVGRLAAEKNLEFLANAVKHFLTKYLDAVFLLVGSGGMEKRIREIMTQAGAADRLIMPGSLTGQDLVDAYAAMDVFVFSSQSETQGMVLAEAMAAGTPAVALDAPGAREIVDEKNGRLLRSDASVEEFAAAISPLVDDRERLKSYRNSARKTAQRFSIDQCASSVLEVYDELVHNPAFTRRVDAGPWDRLRGRLEIEWNLLVEKTSAIAAAARDDDSPAELR